ncbi:MAG: glycosyltransferase family 2 protein [Chthonomonadales bacterium]|nr:glycosyltransferase family 2 protein [Chthonomonadales bacterium]
MADPSLAVAITRFPAHGPAADRPAGPGVAISVVVPVFDEVENVDALVPAVLAPLREMGRTHELIIVDDGSVDGTFDALCRLADAYPGLVVARLTRNFGQTAALAAGLDMARGEIIVTADGDMQNDPADIPMLVSALEEGYDIVSGWRRNRQDDLFRRIPSAIANWLFRRIVDAPVHDLGCSLKAYRSWVVREIRLYGDMHRFIAALGYLRGARIGEIPVRHHPRTRGRPKYGISRTARVILDLMLVKFLRTYAAAPIRLFGGLGLITIGLGAAILLYLAFQRLVLLHAIGQRPILSLGVLLVFLGVQFITTGLLAELQLRTYHESQRRPIYVVREVARHAPALDDQEASR